MSRKQNKSSSGPLLLTKNPTGSNSFPIPFRSANDDEDFKSSKSNQQETHTSSSRLASMRNNLVKVKLPKTRSQNAPVKSRSRTHKDMSKDPILLNISEIDRQDIITHKIGQIFQSRDKKLEESSVAYKLEEHNFAFGTTSSKPLERERDYKFPLWRESTQLMDENDVSTICCSNLNDFTEAKKNEFDDSFIGNATAEALEAFAIAETGGISQSEDANFLESPVRLAPNDVQTTSSILTPMLNYSLVETPILKDELKKYGLKPVGRPKAKLLLRHIYSETHK